MTRDEFMEFVYNELANNPDNIIANRIIDAADSYAETYSNGGYPDHLFVGEGYKKLSEVISKQTAKNKKSNF